MRRIYATLFGGLALALTGAGPALADIGQIKTLKGEVTLVRAGEEQPAKVGDTLEQADTLKTGADSSVGMTFIDSSRFSAGPNSTIELSRFRFNSTTEEGEFVTDVKKGTLAIISGRIAKGSPEAMSVKTPASILGVRGTRFLVKVEE